MCGERETEDWGTWNAEGYCHFAAVGGRVK